MNENNSQPIEIEANIGRLLELYPEIAQAFEKNLQEQLLLFSKKMVSYGKTNIAMGGDLSDPTDKKLALTGIWIRMNDKMSRLKNLLVVGEKNPLNDESVVDTFEDLSNYAIIAKMVYKDEWK